MASIIRNCSFDGEIEGSLSGGGLVGFVEYDGTYKVMIVNSVNHGSVKGGKRGSGGILGRNTNGRVINCYNTGMVSTTNDSEKVGALVGYNSSNGVIDCCYALQGTSEKMVGNGDFEDCSFLSQEEMISSDFADQLNANVGDDEQYMPWIFA
ncbi:MAG: GLUG motif-containing protein, partial [Clostridiales bacterium]|nr:GLUG motif-containing protein [Clostridiales bacterium]